MEYKIGDKVIILDAVYTKGNLLVGLEGIIHNIPNKDSKFFRVKLPKKDSWGKDFWNLDLELNEFKKVEALNYYYGI